MSLLTFSDDFYVEPSQEQEQESERTCNVTVEIIPSEKDGKPRKENKFKLLIVAVLPDNRFGQLGSRLHSEKGTTWYNPS